MGVRLLLVLVAVGLCWGQTTRRPTGTVAAPPAAHVLWGGGAKIAGHYLKWGPSGLVVADAGGAGGGGAASWGGIGGTLSLQADLWSALQARLLSSEFTWGTLPGKPSAFTPLAHGHSIADVVSLQTALDGKAASSHGHSIGDVTGLQTALDAKALAAHLHGVSDVTGLQGLLDAKAASSHTHAAGDILSGVLATGRLGTGTANSTTFLRGDGAWAVPPTGGGGGAVTSVFGRAGGVVAENGDYSFSQVSGTAAVTQGGTGATDAAGARANLGAAAAAHGHAISDVTNLQAGLDGKAAAAHTHDPADLASAVPVSKGGTGATTAAAARTALGAAATSHSHAIADTTGLQSALDGKAAATHGHAIADTTGLQSALDGKAAASHTHAASDVTSGTMSTARLGTGTANSTTFLRGDNTWATPSGGGGSGMADPGANGVVVRTATNTTTARSLAGGQGVTVVNGDGVSGNPTLHAKAAQASSPLDAVTAAGDFTNSSYVIDANTLQAGSVVEVWASGTAAVGTSSGTMGIGIKLNNTSVLPSVSTASLGANVTGGFVARFTLLVIAAGASGTLEGGSLVTIRSGSSGGSASATAHTTATVAIDTTAANTLKIHATQVTAAGTLTLRTLVYKVYR